MKKKMDILSETPLFSGLPENQLKEIEQIAIEKNLGKVK